MKFNLENTYRDVRAFISDVSGAINFTKDLISSELVIERDSGIFLSTAFWLNRKGYLKKSRHSIFYTIFPTNQDSEEELYLPTKKTYFLYEGCLCSVVYSGDGPNSPSLSPDVVRNSDGRFVITAYSRRDILKKLYHEISTFYKEEACTGRYTILFHDEGGDWKHQRLRYRRNVDSIYLPDDGLSRILEDAREFLKNRQKYTDLGIPWKRVYLLYGPPGTGKSSVITALASNLDPLTGVYVLQSEALTDTALSYAVREVPSFSILALEDIDRTIEKIGFRENAFSFPTLMNILDGPLSPDGCIIILTANNLENIDPALLRSGRIDVRVEFRMLTYEVAHQMSQRFLGEGADTEMIAREFVGKSPADLQARLLEMRNDDTKDCSGTL